jgi:multidrug efflux pump subunit AcrA (membrane-fusion protein)
MFVRVQIEFKQHENVTVVPIAALVKRNGQQGVFEVDRKEKKVYFVPVELGIVNGTQAEILNTQLSGAVVTLGHHLLEDGSQIILPDETRKDRAPRKSGPPGSQQRRKVATGAKP